MLHHLSLPFVYEIMESDTEKEDEWGGTERDRVTKRGKKSVKNESSPNETPKKIKKQGTCTSFFV